MIACANENRDRSDKAVVSITDLPEQTISAIAVRAKVEPSVAEASVQSIEHAASRGKGLGGGPAAAKVDSDFAAGRTENRAATLGLIPSSWRKLLGGLLSSFYSSSPLSSLILAEFPRKFPRDAPLGLRSSLSDDSSQSF